MRYLFIDTETSGLPKDYKAPASNTANWPRVVQMAWLVTDGRGNYLDESSHIIRPEGFAISKDSSKVHGITQQVAVQQGVEILDVLHQLISQLNRAEILIGHNIDFDLKVVQAEIIRANLENPIPGKDRHCTMKSLTDFCAIPSKYGYKWPQLQELHFALYNEEFDGAHDALADVRATAKCFFEAQRRGLINVSIPESDPPSLSDDQGEQIAFRKAKQENTELAYITYLDAVEAGKLAGIFTEEALRLLKEAEDRRMWTEIQANPSLYRLWTFKQQDSAFKAEAQALYQKLKAKLSGTQSKPQFDFPVPEMVYIEGGTFLMGSNEDDAEKPIHEVTLDSFEIGKYPVTQREWQAIMGENPSYFNGDDRPVENISWDDCQVFIQKLNEKTSLNFRLPTEAEWEYAAGGGNVDRLEWAGTDSEAELGDYAWYNENNDGQTRPVGQKKPNPLGLYDLSGNVWEWCQDWYGDYPSEPQTNPTGPGTGVFRVLRGGSWLNDASDCRVADRNVDLPALRYDYIGLRLSRTP